MNLVLLRRALRDINGIHDFIAQADPAAAIAVVERINKSLKLIESNPNAGHPTLERSIREWSVPGLPYVIPYRIKSAQIEILRIYHTSRKRPADWI